MTGSSEHFFPTLILHLTRSIITTLLPLPPPSFSALVHTYTYLIDPVVSADSSFPVGGDASYFR